jgi:antitoxin (DNA-binding transcriptional repressor) of toxin-antitoxin stability system
LLSTVRSVTFRGMKAVTIREAQGQLGELIAEACRGELIVLTDGDRQVALEPRALPDLEEDSPELEAELLKAVKGPHTPFSEGELRELASRALGERRARGHK